VNRALRNIAKKLVQPAMTSNVEFNRWLWNRYARRWSTAAPPIDRALPDEIQKEHLRRGVAIVGDEWGRSDDINEVLNDFVHPYITRRSVVAEIGVGGGRLAVRIAPHVAQFYGFDIAKRMLRHAERELAHLDNVNLVLLYEPKLPDELSDRIDFIYAFDVLVHLDLHTQWKYFREIHRVLKVGGHAMVHTTNLLAPAGWARFATQDEYSVHGHYFVSPEVVRTFANRGGFELVKASLPQSTNFYYYRDFIATLAKRTAAVKPEQ
jgi:SAM-dependent methyltransferase